MKFITKEQVAAMLESPTTTVKAISELSRVLGMLISVLCYHAGARVESIVAATMLLIHSTASDTEIVTILEANMEPGPTEEQAEDAMAKALEAISKANKGEGP